MTHDSSCSTMTHDKTCSRPRRISAESYAFGAKIHAAKDSQREIMPRGTLSSSSPLTVSLKLSSRQITRTKFHLRVEKKVLLVRRGNHIYHACRRIVTHGGTDLLGIRANVIIFSHFQSVIRTNQVAPGDCF